MKKTLLSLFLLAALVLTACGGTAATPEATEPVAVEPGGEDSGRCSAGPGQTTRATSTSAEDVITRADCLIAWSFGGRQSSLSDD